LSEVAAVRLRPRGIPVGMISTASLALLVFLGGFVFREPAPYELALAAIIPVWALAGLKVPRDLAPLFVLMLLFVVGGILAITQSKVIDREPMYIAVSAFLAASSCFFAAVVAEDAARRARVITVSWIAAAVATVTLGFIGYAGLSGELFTRYGRAAGGFEDPNVFGPFLAFPVAILVGRAMRARFLPALVSGALALYLLLGVFLSFSRAAWGLAILAPAIVVLLAFVNERRQMARARYIALAAAGLALVAVALAGALSVEAVRTLFAERAQLVQDYDAAEFGRFARHWIGFNMMAERPLGLGALEFGHIFGEDEHNIWLKTLTTYGWLGFVSYLTLTLWTLIAAAPLLFRTSPWQRIAQAAYAVYLGHVLMGWVIDINHWRHVYLLIGLLWGLIAADRLRRRRSLIPARVVQPAPLSVQPVPTIRIASGHRRPYSPPRFGA